MVDAQVVKDLTGLKLNREQKEFLEGKKGGAAQTSMRILAALAGIYNAKRLVPVSSAQIAGVSYHNIGSAGLQWLEDMARDGKAMVKATLNPAGMDLRQWKKLGIRKSFAEKQIRVVKAFTRMGVKPTLTCTPYLVGNKPRKGEHVAWAESSAVCYANSVLGARTNREGGPSALASALTGYTPEYGMHLAENRQAKARVLVEAKLENTADYRSFLYLFNRHHVGRWCGGFNYPADCRTV